MRLRRLVPAALASVAVLSACDTDDGRDMQPPDSYAVYQLQNTAPSTTSTLPVPTELATTPATSPTTLPESTGPVGSAEPGDSASSAPADAGTLAFPDLSAEGLQLTGPWESGAAIDASFTCDGAGQAPLLTWTAPPAGVVELALTVLDEDAGGFVHWLVVGLPATAGSLGGGEALAAGTEAQNSFGAPGWGGPCPPPGDGAHTYRFTLHALSQSVEVPAEAEVADLLAAIDSLTAGVVTLTGTYERA